MADGKTVKNKIQAKGKIINYDVCKRKLSFDKSGLLETEMFLNGDHWQGGKGWNGYRPDPTADEGGKTLLTIQRAFTPKNVCLGIVNRIVGTTFGKAPDFSIVSSKTPEPSAGPADDTESAAPVLTEEQKRFQAIDAALVVWMDKRGVHEKLKEFVYNKAAYGKASLRIYIPTGYLIGGRLTGKFEEILEKIYIDVPHFSMVTDDLDQNFGEKYTILEIKQDSGRDSVFEVCYLDPETKATVLRQVTANDTNAAGATDTGMVQLSLEGETRSDANIDLVEVDLGGNLLTYVAGEYKSAIISPTVKAGQRSVDSAKTGETLALANINYPDTTFINADIPETVQETVGNVTIEKRNKLKFGPGIWRKLAGYVTSDEAGNEQIATPDVKFRDGADPEKFRKVADANTRDMYEDAGMLYIYIASSPYPSGDSRAEAMTDYLILIIALKTLCDQVGTWLLTTVVRLAFNFSGETKLINEFKTIFASKMTIGRVSNEDKTTMMKEVEIGARTLRNYMIVAETTDDPDGEVMAYLVEKKAGWHQNLDSTTAKAELDQNLEVEKMKAETQVKVAENQAAAFNSGGGRQ